MSESSASDSIKSTPRVDEETAGNGDDSLDIVLETLIASCSYKCGQTGIPILPVVFSRDDYRVSGKDKRYFRDELSSESAKHDAIASLPTHTYLYCFYEDKYEYSSIEEKRIGKEGALSYYKTYNEEDFVVKNEEDTNKIEVTNIDEPDDDELDEIVQPATCDRDEHSTLDSKYITLRPGSIAWLMVSHAKLSKATLKKYFYDEALRDKRMQKFVTNDLADNKNTKSMSKYFPEIEYINSFHQRKQLEQGGDIDDKIRIYEKDGKEGFQGSWSSALQLYKSMERSINDNISNIEKNIKNYEGGASPEEVTALKILKDTKPMMVALHDPVGEVLAAAEKRNYLLKKLDDAQKNKGQIREQVNAIIIDNIKNSVEAANQSSVHEQQGYSRAGLNRNRKANAAVGRNVYNYINESKFKAVLATAKKSRKDKAAIAAARQTFIDAIKRSEFAFVMREDFPENDEESHLGYAQIIAEAIQGIGIDESNIGMPDAIWADYKPEQTAGITAKQEFEQTLLPCISGEQPTADNWFFKALIGLDKEDLNRFENPPAYQNLERASDASGAVTQWIEMFDKNKKKKKIAKNASTSVAAKVDEINKIAANQARIIETYSNNQQYIQTEHGLLNRGEVYIRASVAKTSGWKQGFLKVLHIPLKHQVKKNITKASLNIDSKLLPAAIDKEAVLASSSVSRRSAPLAIDFVKTFNLDATAVRTVNDAASGNQQAVLDVVTYLGDDAENAINKTISLNRQLSQSGTELDSLLRTIDDDYRQLDRRSAGKAAMISAAVMAFQLRSTLINKDKISAMVARGDRDSIEFMTAYTSTTLALTSASLDVANAGLQMKVARSAWVARLSFSSGLLGAVGAGFEVYSLRVSREKHIESKSDISRKATNIAIISASTAGVAGLAIGLGFVMPWVVGIVAVAWAVSLIAQWIAFTYDKSHILPIHYWLDAGVFGNKEMIDVNNYPNNPFSDPELNIKPMANLEQDIHAYMLAMTEFTITPKFDTRVSGNTSILTGTIAISISQWQKYSWIGITFYPINNNGDPIAHKDSLTRSSTITYLIESGEAKQKGDYLVITKKLPQIRKRNSSGNQSYWGLDSKSLTDTLSKEEIQKSNYLASDDIEGLEVIVTFKLSEKTEPLYELSSTIKSN